MLKKNHLINTVAFPFAFLIAFHAAIAVAFTITIAAAIAVPVAFPNTTTSAPPHPTKFSKLEYIFNVQHTYFITFQTVIKR
jgi:hypothetical protein